jgi:hypothetical protein
MDAVDARAPRRGSRVFSRACERFAATEAAEESFMERRQMNGETTSSGVRGALDSVRRSLASQRRATLWLGALLALGATACDGGGTTPDAGTARQDAGGDAGAECPTPPSLPTGTRPETVNCPDEAPFPEEQMGTCCYRHSNADQLDAPELRLTYLKLVAPVGSTLTSSILTGTLGDSLQRETFNWLFRVEGADSDGPVNIVTGFGRRQPDGTYAFSSGAAGGDPGAWCPVTIPATLTGETVESEPIPGSVTVPIFDEAGEVVQIELTLRQIAIEESSWGEDRSCVGWKVARNLTYFPAGQLSGFIELEPSRTATISVPPITTTVCAAIAGEDLGNPDYCDTPQGEWQTPPDSLCDESGCRANAPCQSDVCDPATTCNAWRIVAQFAAAGVDIANGSCE